MENMKFKIDIFYSFIALFSFEKDLSIITVMI